MTATTFNHLVQGTPAALQRLSDSITAFFKGIGDARAMAEDFKTFSQMSDTRLAHLGIKREQIPQMVLDRHIRD